MKTFNGACLVLAMLLIEATSLAQGTTDNTKKSTNKEVNMSMTQRNKEVIQKLYEQALNKRNLELLKDLVSENYTGIGGKKGPAAFEQPVAELIKAFPDLQWKIEELIGEGNKVVIRWKVEGTHTAQFQYIAATGKTVSSGGMGIYDLKDGKVVGAQVLTDRVGFLQQLEVLPFDLASLVKKTHKDQVNFIDKFFVPAAAKKEFYERMSINRNFIKTLPGFIEDAAYEYTDDNGNLICVTVALWENKEALAKAKEAVQAEYKKQGFDAAEMLKRLNISADRGTYTAVQDH